MQEKSKKEYGEYLRKARERLAISRDQLAMRLGVSGHTVKQVELGLQNLGKPAKMMLERLLKDGASRVAEPGYGEHTTGSPLQLQEIAARLADSLTEGDLKGKAAEIAKTLGCTEKQALKAALMVELEKIGGKKR